MSEVLPDSELDFAEGLAQRTREEAYVQMSVNQNLIPMAGFTVSALEMNMALDLPLSQNPYISYERIRSINRVRNLILYELVSYLPQEVVQNHSQQELLDAYPAWRDAHMHLGILLNHFIYMHKKHLGEMTMSQR